MPKAKNKLFPSIRVSEELYEATVKLAEKENEYLSDYIRKAVEMRNSQTDVHLKNSEIEYKPKPTISEPKEKPKQVQTFMKGGK